MSRRTTILLFAAIFIAGVCLVLIFRRQLQEPPKNENHELQSQSAPTENNTRNPTEPAPHSESVSEPPSGELLRLRGEVGVLRRQAEELKASLAQAQQKTQQTPQVQGPLSESPEEYPATPQAATTGIFQTLMQGDLEKFAANFGEPGVPKELYDKLFGSERAKTFLAQIDSVTLGEPTNSFGYNMWFVPYKLHFKDGNEKEMQLHVAQDPRTGKWYFKGGL